MVNSEPTDGVMEVSRTRRCASAAMWTEMSSKLAIPDPRIPEIEELLEELPEAEELPAEVEATDLDLLIETDDAGVTAVTAETERED